MNRVLHSGDELQQLQQLGKSGNVFEGLEVFPKPEGCTEVIFTNDGEFTALCPKTGQPDFYDLEICYEPDKSCVESKSLKLYLFTFRDTGAFCEKLAAQICKDFVAACSPFYCEVSLTMRPRGGIGMTASSEYMRPNLPNLGGEEMQ